MRGGKPPRSRNRSVPSCRPNQERYRVALWGVQLSPGSGEGQSHRETEVGRERGCPINKPRCRAMCPRTPRGARGTDPEIVVGRLNADRPCRLELSVGLTLSSSGSGVGEEPVGIECLVPLEHEIDGTAELVARILKAFPFPYLCLRRSWSRVLWGRCRITETAASLKAHLRWTLRSCARRSRGASG